MPSSPRILIGSSLSLFLVLFASVVFAQTDANGAGNVIRIEAGKILEIGTDTVSKKPDFSWILSKDRTFQSAQRSRFFQTRFAQTGIYALDVSAQDAETSQNDYHAFQIIVTDPAQTLPVQNSGSVLKAKLTTIPSAIHGTVYVSEAGGLISIAGSETTGKITAYSLDLDSTVDSDNDGNPTNDHDNQNTYSAQTGAPLTYFLTPGQTDRIITLTVTDAVTGQTDSDSVHIVFGPPPIGSVYQTASDSTNPIVITGKNNTAEFSTRLPSELILGKELLYEWDFGDRSRSLLTTPTHTYDSAGSFTVSLTVRDITNGQILYQGTNAVQIQATAESSSSAGSNQNASSSSSGSTTGTVVAGPSNMWSIIKVGFIIMLLLGLAIGLYLLFTWIKRKTTGTLVKTIEDMEKTIVKSDKATIDVEPLKIKKETPVPKREDVSDREKSKTEFASTTSENATPSTASAPVPSWLAKASSAQNAPKTTAAPTPAPAPAAAYPKPTAPSPMTTTEKPASAPPVPDWLKQAPTKKEVTPKPAPVNEKSPLKPAQETTKPPVVQPPVAPTLAPTPAPTPKPTVIEKKAEPQASAQQQTPAPGVSSPNPMPPATQIKAPLPPPTPAPAPVVPQPKAPLPEPQPTIPVSKPTEETPKQTPVVPEKPKVSIPVAPPVQKPKPEAPKAPTVTPTQQTSAPPVKAPLPSKPEIPTAKKEVSLATQTPKAPAAAKQVPKDIPQMETKAKTSTPSPLPQPKKAVKKDDEPPIAIIKADSLMK